ncbi:uncharacterized protein [Euwallacea fornicatus]|uniref:uncharacterized protein n=1 Tax=Euwallacea fornicatus TaxID=995702 RepID=UPI00338EE021
MTKFFQFIVLACAVIWRVSSQIEPEEDDKNIFFNSHNYHKAKQQAKDNAVQFFFKICPNHTPQIKDKLKEFQTCSEKINEDDMMLCKVVEQNLKNCSTPLINFFEACVPKQAKGIPTYLLDIIQKLVRYVCASNGAHILELENPCILSTKQLYSRTCIRKLKEELEMYNYENLPEKTAICLFLDQFTDCFNTHVQKSCQDSTTREAYIGLYQNFLCTK